ncbi:MAG: hypothetical protein KIS87_10150 [Phycisphaeraceae bacterium]|nr:hypothetical protein [Phycisphaeraceae bacterium]
MNTRRPSSPRHAAFVEQLEARCLLTGYFAGGIDYNGSVDFFLEFGQLNDQLEVLFGSRTSINGQSVTPYESFTPGAELDYFQGSIGLKLPDEFAERTTVDFLNRPWGFSFAYNPDSYQVSISYLMKWASNLGEGPGSRDGHYYFSGLVQDVVNDRFDITHGPAFIDGVTLTGEQRFEHLLEAIAFEYQFAAAQMFIDGYTRFDGHSSIAMFGDSARTVLQADFDGSDGFRSYSHGVRINPDANFTPLQLAGNVYAMTLAGSPSLAEFFGLTPTSERFFSYPGALELADGNTFRYYWLDDFYGLGRDNAQVVLDGTYNVTGDWLSLTARDGQRSMEFKLGYDLSTMLNTRYKFSLESAYLHSYGAGTLIRDGAPGDFPAVNFGPADDDGDPHDDGDPIDDDPSTPTVYTFTSASVVADDDGNHYVIGRTIDDKHIRFNVTQQGGVGPFTFGLTVSLTDNGQGLKCFGANDSGVYIIRRSPAGQWSTQKVNQSAADAYGITPVSALDNDGNRTFAGFNQNGTPLRYDVNGSEIATVLDGVINPDGNPAAPTVVADMHVTPWNAWHFFYIDGIGDLRVVWTAPGLNTYYNNNLSTNSGLRNIDATGISAITTDWHAIHVSLTVAGTLWHVWWAPELIGNWVASDFSGIFGEPATNLRPDSTALHFDRVAGDFYNFAIRNDDSDISIFRWEFAQNWTHQRAIGDLMLDALTIPDSQTSLSAGSNGNFTYQGRVPVLGQIPVLGGLFSSRPAGDSTSSLLTLVQPFIINVNDVIDDI